MNTDMKEEVAKKDGIDILCEVCEFYKSRHYAASKHFCCKCFADKYISENFTLQDQLKQRDETIKELKIEASKWAFECDRAKQDRDKAEKQTQQLKEALRDLIPIADYGYTLLVPFDKKHMGVRWFASIQKARNFIVD